MTTNLLAREHLVLGSTLLFLLLALVVVACTLVGPLSSLLLGRTIVVGESLYNYTLIPVALSLLALTALAPLMPGADHPSRHSAVSCGSAWCQVAPSRQSVCFLPSFPVSSLGTRTLVPRLETGNEGCLVQA